MAATIKIEFNCGDNISDAFKEAIRIAITLNVWVEFNFNGVPCCVNASGVVADGVKSYQEQLKNSPNCFTAFA